MAERTPMLVRIPPDLKTKLEEHAEREKRSVTNLVTVILTNWVAEQEAVAV